MRLKDKSLIDCYAQDKTFFSALLIAVIFVSSIAGTSFYYNGIIKDRDAQITLINNQIDNLTSQVSNLTAQIADLSPAYRVTRLGINEISARDTFNDPYPELYIEGSVTNTGERTGYNAGLHVIAYNAAGECKINMTLPLASATAAYDAQSSFFVTTKLGKLYGGATADIDIDINHQGVVTNWTVTPCGQILHNWTILDLPAPKS